MVAKLGSSMVPSKHWIHLLSAQQSAQSWVQEVARASVTHRGIYSTVEIPDIPIHSGF